MMINILIEYNIMLIALTQLYMKTLRLNFFNLLMPKSSYFQSIYFQIFNLQKDHHVNPCFQEAQSAVPNVRAPWCRIKNPAG